MRFPPLSHAIVLNTSASLDAAPDVRRFSGLRAVAAAPTSRRQRRGGRRQQQQAQAVAVNGNGKLPAESRSWDTISTDELEDWQEQGPPTPLLDTGGYQTWPLLALCCPALLPVLSSVLPVCAAAVAMSGRIGMSRSRPRHCWTLVGRSSFCAPAFGCQCCFCSCPGTHLLRDCSCE